MKAKFIEFAARIDAYTLRERILFFLVGIVGIYAFFDYLLITPLLSEAKSMSLQLEQQKTQLAVLRAQQQAIIKRSQTDPDAANRKKQGDLIQNVEQLNDRLQKSTVDLISPKNMSAVLESVLAKNEGLQLEKITVLPPVSLADLLNAENGANASIPGVYQHGLKITFSGGYLDTLAYLQALESLDWRFYWGDVDFNVTEYPEAEVTIVVNTLSLNESWIGI